MLVFKILVVIAFLLCLVNFAFGIHTLVCTNKFLGSIENWAEEIDRSNFNYIKQEFARLRYENGLYLCDRDKDDVINNDIEIIDEKDE